MEKINLDIDSVKSEIVLRLKELKPKKIILFGSYIYGEPGRNSDLDICVIAPNNLPKRETKRKIRRLLGDLNIAKDILTPSEKEFEFYRKEFGSVFMDIDQKGEVLWTSS